MTKTGQKQKTRQKIYYRVHFCCFIHHISRFGDLSDCAQIQSSFPKSLWDHQYFLSTFDYQWHQCMWVGFFPWYRWHGKCRPAEVYVKNSFWSYNRKSFITMKAYFVKSSVIWVGSTYSSTRDIQYSVRKVKSALRGGVLLLRSDRVNLQLPDRAAVSFPKVLKLRTFTEFVSIGLLMMTELCGK